MCGGVTMGATRAVVVALACVASSGGMMDMSPSYVGTAPCTSAPATLLEDVRGRVGGDEAASVRSLCVPGCSVSLAGFYYAD